MKKFRYAMAVGIAAAALMAAGGVATAQTAKPSGEIVMPQGLDTKERADLPACTVEVIKKGDCHIHDTGTHIQMTSAQPDASRPHAAKEFDLFMKAQHGR